MLKKEVETGPDPILAGTFGELDLDPNQKGHPMTGPVSMFQQSNNQSHPPRLVGARWNLGVLGHVLCMHESATEGPA